MLKPKLLSLFAGALGLSTTLAGCGSDFTEFNFIDRLRVLGVSADKPWLKPNESTQISAKVVNPVGSTVRYRWSWCPLLGGVDQDYGCALSEADLQTAIDTAVGAGTVTVPPYEIGTSSTALFDYNLPAAFFEGACEGLRNLPNIPRGVSLPSCNGTYTITIITEVITPEDKITAHKAIELIYDETIPANTNPVMQGLSFRKKGDANAPIVSLPSDTTMERGVEYELIVDIGEEQTETYTTIEVNPDGEKMVTLKENLIFTWFIESGETDRNRTGYYPNLENARTLDEARTNLWTPPKKIDFAESETTLHVLIQDNRKGLSWLSRKVKLAD